jgi:hypothetical protein
MKLYSVTSLSLEEIYVFAASPDDEIYLYDVEPGQFQIKIDVE